MSVEKKTRRGVSRDERGRIIVAFTAMSVLAGVIAAGIAMPTVGLAGAVSNAAVETFQSLPKDLETPVLPQRVEMVDSDGEHLAWYYTQNRVVIPFREMGEYLPKALVAIEDERFYEHNGVDLRGTVRALVANRQSGSIQQGGSTITQQYVKQILLTQAGDDEEAQQAAVARTASRKIREAAYAIAMEQRLSKKKILEGYLNIAYFGAGAYGAQAAAQRYFGKPASELSLPQAALLAGLVQAPGAFDPIENPQPARDRRNIVLRKMAAQGMITQAEAKAAIKVRVVDTLNPQSFLNGCPQTDAAYFCDYVLTSIRQNPVYGKTRKQREALLDRGGFVIRTSPDRRVQEGAQKATFDRIPKTDSSGKAVAISMVEPGTGKVLAMAQNRDWGTSGAGNTTYNYNTEQRYGGTIGMQAGSTFKVFTLAAALEKGISPYTTIVSPQKKTFYGFKDCNGFYFPPYTVENSTGSGTFNMYSGTANSVNTFFIGLEQQVDLCRQAEIAEAMGLKRGDGSKLERVPSFPLGSNDVTPLGMANAYATFANHGAYCEPTPVVHMQYFNGGDKFFEAQPRCSQAVSPSVADQVTQILVGVVNNGTGRTANFGRPAAGKTGTTDSNAAVWFAGYTPDVAAAVWVGDPRGGYQYPIRDIYINGVFYSRGAGSLLAAPVWRSAMITAHEDLPYRGFTSGEPPAGLPE